MDESIVQRAIDPLHKSRLAEVNHQLMIQRQRHKDLTSLYSLGYAAPAEIQQVAQRIEALDNAREVLQNAAPSPPVRLDTTPRSIRIDLPGFANYVHADVFGQVVLDTIEKTTHDGPTQTTTPSVPLATNADAQKRSLQAELDLWNELHRRLQQINDHSPASTTEIDHVANQIQRLQLALTTATTPRLIATAFNDDSNDSPPVLCKDQQQRWPVAVDEVRVRRDQLVALHKRSERSQEDQQRQLSELSRLRQDAVIRREIAIAKLRADHLAATTKQLSFEVQRTQTQLEYLRLLEHTDHEIDRDALTKIVTRMLRIEADNQTNQQLAMAEAARWKDRTEALETLLADGHATWLETQRSKVAWLRAIAAIDDAKYRQALAKNILDRISQETLGAAAPQHLGQR